MSTCFIVAGSHMQCHHVWLTVSVNFDYGNYACIFMPLTAMMLNSLFPLPLVTAACTVYDKTFEGKMFAVPVVNIYYVGKTYGVYL